MQILLSNSQARSCRTIKYEQVEISSDIFWPLIRLVNNVDIWHLWYIETEKCNTEYMLQVADRLTIKC